MRSWRMLRGLPGPVVILVLAVPEVMPEPTSDARGPVLIRQLADRLRVTVADELFAEYRFDLASRPILYPIIGPHGIPMTRHYPMKEDVPGEQHDHPHHTSLWYAHGPVNDVDFFRIGPEAGRIVHQRVMDIQEGRNRAQAKVASSWLAPTGEVELTDVRTIVFQLLDGMRAIDWNITIVASHGEVVFGDSDHGALAIRTHPGLRLANQPEEGVTTARGRALNSEGVTADASSGIGGEPIWGERARWIDYWGDISGKTVGMAILDHPENPRHPTHWMARGYGYVAACPFGLNSFEGEPLGTGDMTIPTGETVTFRYRLIFHDGDPKQARIERHWERYATEPLPDGHPD